MPYGHAVHAVARLPPLLYVFTGQRSNMYAIGVELLNPMRALPLLFVVPLVADPDMYHPGSVTACMQHNFQAWLYCVCGLSTACLA